jgi:hypothetical protein
MKLMCALYQGLIYFHLLCPSQVVLRCLSYLSHQIVHDMFVHAMCVFLNVSGSNWNHPLVVWGPVSADCGYPHTLQLQ